MQTTIRVFGQGYILGQIAQEIEKRLNAAFAPVHLQVVDESHKHKGHGGYREGVETHFRVELVASVFAGQTRITRQRSIIAVLRDLMENPIHALSLSALTPDEHRKSTD